MPREEQYLANTLGDGLVRIQMGYSLRGAAKLFGNRCQVGQRFRIKKRGEGTWQYYVTTNSGIRITQPWGSI